MGNQSSFVAVLFLRMCIECIGYNKILLTWTLIKTEKTRIYCNIETKIWINNPWFENNWYILHRDIIATRKCNNVSVSDACIDDKHKEVFPWLCIDSLICHLWSSHSMWNSVPRTMFSRYVLGVCASRTLSSSQEQFAQRRSIIACYCHMNQPTKK